MDYKLIDRNSGLETFVATIYVCILPLRMPTVLSGLGAILHGAGLYIDVIFHMLGLFLMLLSYRGSLFYNDTPGTFLWRKLWRLVIYLDISSLVMALVIQLSYGSYAGESAFRGVLGQIVYMLQYAFMVLYNMHVIRLLGQEKLERILWKVCVGLLLLGYIQIGVMTLGGPIAQVYDRIDFLGFFHKSGFTKLPLTGLEGSSVSGIFGTFAGPFLFSCMLQKRRGAKLMLFLWLPVIFFTYSTSTYLTFVLLFIVYCVLKGRKSASFGVIVCGGLIIVAFLLIFGVDISINIGSGKRSVQYLLFEKIFDRNNDSTVSRLIPIITNWKAFLRYPILGVGNGLQGYFYLEDIPSWALEVSGVGVSYYLKRAATMLGNGGLFFPSLLSGYGVVGMPLIAAFVINLGRVAKLKSDNLLQQMFNISILSVLAFGMQTDFAGQYMLWFVLSIPFAINCDPEEHYE